eukprot:NODE_47_length_32105_cov_1.240892.p6 type:complete len:342 gc:universal NODE_47_length_32105_cov_1.240892:19806-18781(-)
MDIFSPAQVLTGGYFSFLYRWFWPASSSKSDLAEKQLLSTIQNHKIGWVQLDNKRAINTLMIKAPNEKRVLLITHGFGVGLAYFFKTYPHLMSLVNQGTSIYAIDWLGMGRSTRNKINGKSLQDVEGYFIDSLEEWRCKMKIDKMVLFGHSLGGYLSTCYAIKYPSTVDQLILCSPAGFPEPPTQQRKWPWYGAIIKYLWTKSVTPQSIVRTLGPFGPRMLSGYTQRRFKHLNPNDLNNLHNYLYQISVDSGAGEYAISHIFLPGAYAKSPLCHRFKNVTCPTQFIYGTSDWMDKEGAYLAISKHPNPEMHKVYLSAGGHHMYLDDHWKFNDLLLDILQNK